MSALRSRSADEVIQGLARGALLVLLAVSAEQFALPSPMRAQLINISLAKPGPLLRIDSANWSEAWIEVCGTGPLAKKLDVDDLAVTNEKLQATMLSVDSIGARFRSRLALSFVLDNSGSVFHSYDSLTKMCDGLADSLPAGAIVQAVTFDNIARSDSHLYTRHANVFIAQSGFRDTIASAKAYWHFYDTIRTNYTPLYDAIAAAIANIQSRRVSDGEHSHEDVLIVVTDGDDNASRADIATLTDLVSTAHVRLFAISFRTEIDHRLALLARHSQGEYYRAFDITDLRDLLRSIGHRLSTQYHIRYRFPALTPIRSH